MTENVNALPFLTRKMLNFEHGLNFKLYIRAQASVAGNVTIRGMTKEGIFTFQLPLTNLGALQEATFAIPDIPIAVSVLDSDQNFEQGNLYVALALTVNDDVVQELCAGMVYANHGISYPASSVADIMPQRGAIKTVLGNDPGAGIEIQDAVPAGRVWRLMAIRFSLVTSATVANRRVHVQITDDLSNNIVDIFSDQDQAASLTRQYSFAPFSSIPDTLDDDDILAPFVPDLYLLEGSEIRTSTTNLQAGDNFGAIRFHVEEFFTPS